MKSKKIKLTPRQLEGKPFPRDAKGKVKGPFPSGVINGPQPRTERGKRRRQRRVGSA